MMVFSMSRLFAKFQFAGAVPSAITMDYPLSSLPIARGRHPVTSKAYDGCAAAAHSYSSAARALISELIRVSIGKSTGRHTYS